MPNTFKALCVILASGLLSPAFAQSGDLIPRTLLIDMANDQYSVLCASPVFASCMGFTEPVCTRLADEAIKQCLQPLPETIDPEELDNSSLESCPIAVFEDAGFSEEKAGICFKEAMEAEGS